LSHFPLENADGGVNLAGLHVEATELGDRGGGSLQGGFDAGQLSHSGRRFANHF